VTQALGAHARGGTLLCLEVDPQWRSCTCAGLFPALADALVLNDKCQHPLGDGCCFVPRHKASPTEPCARTPWHKAACLRLSHKRRGDEYSLKRVNQTQGASSVFVAESVHPSTCQSWRVAATSTTALVREVREQHFIGGRVIVTTVGRGFESIGRGLSAPGALASAFVRCCSRR
jgi:hypothetical protein